MIMSSIKLDKLLNEEDKFVKQLFQSLKYYGYLFPQSSADVERFEVIYGATEIEIPEYLDSFEKILSNNEQVLKIDLTNSIAAFSSKEKKTFKIPDDIELNDDEQHPDGNN
jgi:hypothetical protein